MPTERESPGQATGAILITNETASESTVACDAIAVLG
jgi:hypothetical protein